MTPEMKRLNELLQVAALAPGSSASVRAGEMALELIEKEGVRAVGGPEHIWTLNRVLPAGLRRALFRAKWRARWAERGVPAHHRGGV
jgi:hypothetical protein